MRANRADARDGRPHRQTVPSRCRTSLIAPIRPLRCHSHPESANALFSTLGVRVQTERALTGHPAGCRRPGPLAGNRALRHAFGDLHRADCLGLRPAIALRDLEFDPLAFFEAAVAIRLDGREVDEDVPTTVDRDEAVALVRVEPFDGALSHYQQLPNSARASGSALVIAEPVDRGTGLTCCAS